MNSEGVSKLIEAVEALADDPTAFHFNKVTPVVPLKQVIAIIRQYETQGGSADCEAALQKWMKANYLVETRWGEGKSIARMAWEEAWRIRAAQPITHTITCPECEGEFMCGPKDVICKDCLPRKELPQVSAELVERVARAICRVGISGPKQHLDDQEIRNWRKFELEAQAAIAVMQDLKL